MKENEFELFRLVKERDLRDRENDRRELVSRLTTKLKTSFIGAIVRFEEFFGHLWGHNKPWDSLTQSQVEMRNVWESCRHQILDNGNKQIRGMESELQDRYFRYTFKRR